LEPWQASALSPDAALGFSYLLKCRVLKDLLSLALKTHNLSYNNLALHIPARYRSFNAHNLLPSFSHRTILPNTKLFSVFKKVPHLDTA